MLPWGDLFRAPSNMIFFSNNAENSTLGPIHLATNTKLLFSPAAATAAAPEIPGCSCNCECKSASTAERARRQTPLAALSIPAILVRLSLSLSLARALALPYTLAFSPASSYGSLFPLGINTYESSASLSPLSLPPLGRANRLGRPIGRDGARGEGRLSHSAV